MPLVHLNCEHNDVDKLMKAPTESEDKPASMYLNNQGLPCKFNKLKTSLCALDEKLNQVFYYFVKLV